MVKNDDTCISLAMQHAAKSPPSLVPMQASSGGGGGGGGGRGLGTRLDPLHASLIPRPTCMHISLRPGTFSHMRDTYGKGVVEGCEFFRQGQQATMEGSKSVYTSCRGELA